MKNLVSGGGIVREAERAGDGHAAGRL